MNIENVIALDLGTTKFCLARLNLSGGNGSSEAIETVSVPAKGMQKGMLSNISEATEALNSLLELGEKHFKIDISFVSVGIAGSHLKSRICSTTKKINSNIINQKTVNDLKYEIQTKNENDKREILHIVPLGYKIDDRDWIANPIGFSGTEIHGEYFILDADKGYLSDVIRLCNQSGLEVKRFIAEPFASASVTANFESRKVGVVVADIGGGTTDGLVFQSGKPVSSFTINIGGKLMTKDLAIGLGLKADDAEVAKVHFGIQRSTEDDILTFCDVNGKFKTVSWKDVYRILGPRISELGLLIKQHTNSFSSSLGAGLLLTGGGSEVFGISNYLQKEIEMNVLTICPDPISYLENSITSKYQIKKHELATKFATVAGILNTEIQLQFEEKNLNKPSWTGKYFGNFINWLKELS